MAPILFRGKRWGRIILCATMHVVVAASACAATLFPQPLHLVRKITDPLSHATSTVDEYCQGNRIVSTTATRAVIVDYDKHTVTEIDRAAGTYSIASFDEIAHADAALRPPRAVAEKAVEWKTTPLRASAWRFERSGSTIEVAVDPKIAISREALDALIGAAYPNRRTPEHDVLTRASGGGVERVKAESSQSQQTFALPVDETVTWQAENSTITVRNVLVRVSSEVAPADVVMIPPGAKRVQSRRVALPHMIEELDRVPAAPLRP